MFSDVWEIPPENTSGFRWVSKLNCTVVWSYQTETILMTLDRLLQLFTATEFIA